MLRSGSGTSCQKGGMERSPLPPGGSTRTTSAPRPARSLPANAPFSSARSRTRMPPRAVNTPPPTPGGSNTPPPTPGGSNTPPPAPGGSNTPPPAPGGSMHLAAAGDGERDAGHVLGAAEVDGGVGDLLRRLFAPEEREALHEILEDAVGRDAEHPGQDRVEHLGPHRRLDVAGAERVDGDVHRPELLGERLGQRDDGRLRGAVRAEPSPS